MSNATITPLNWTENLPGNKRLVDTFIPGSHDSSAFPSPDGMGLGSEAVGAITQAGNYLEQLNAGIRYFDVRCTWLNLAEGVHGPVMLHHGIVGAERFETVLVNQILQFSNDNPNEIIFLDIDISEDCEDGVLEILKNKIHKDHIATEHLNSNGTFNSNVTWGDLRRKKRRFVITWSSTKYTKAESNNRLFGSWSGLVSTPTMVEKGDALRMCLLDSDGRIFFAQSHDGLAWSDQGQTQKQRLFGSWADVKNGSTPTMVVFNDKYYMCLLDNKGSIFITSSDDFTTWTDRQRLFGDWSDVPSTPTMVVFNNTLYMCLLDSDGHIYITSSSDGSTWQSNSDVHKNVLFAPWYGIVSTPTMVVFDKALYMCLLDSDGHIYITSSSDGSTWPTNSEVHEHRLFGGWSDVSGKATPTMINYINGTAKGNLIMCRLNNHGAIFTSVSDDGLNWYFDDIDRVVPYLSYNEQLRWSPYDDFDKHNLEEILAYLDSYTKKWNKNRMFVAQVIDTPRFSPLTSPRLIERAYGAELNAWVTNHKKNSNINIIMRDFVNHYPDMINYVINLNF